VINLAPVLLRELRSQMRGRRAMWALTAYLSILLLVALAVYAIALTSVPEGATETGESVGKALFVTLSVLQASLVVLLAPAFTANAISQEREQKTFDLLAVTLVEPASIVLGKLLASLAYLGMVLVASLPVMALAFLFGGVEPSSVAKVFAVEMLLALVFGSVGIFFSSFVRRTLWSTVFSYVAIFTLVAVGPIVDTAINAVRGASDYQPFLLYLNPFPLILSVAVPEFAEEMAKTVTEFTLLTPILYLALTGALFAAAVYFVGPKRAASGK